MAIGLRPRLADRVQPIVQFLAAFPANLFFPAAVVLILRFPAQPGDLAQPADDPRDAVVHPVQCHRGHHGACRRSCSAAAQNLGVRRWLWWRRVMLPAIFPAYVTGAVTAAGGSWNASIVSEVVQWGDTTLTATGIGAYIAQHDRRGRRRRGSRSGSACCASTCSPSTGCCGAGSTISPPNGCGSIDAQLPTEALPMTAAAAARRGRLQDLPDARIISAGWCSTDVDFTLRDGEIVAILGKSGSGKSTFLRILAGLIPPSDGQSSSIAASRCAEPVARHRDGVPELSRCSRG